MQCNQTKCLDFLTQLQPTNPTLYDSAFAPTRNCSLYFRLSSSNPPLVQASVQFYF